MKRGRWTMEQIEDFRAWHEKKLEDMYADCPNVQKELRRDREKFLSGLMPITQ